MKNGTLMRDVTGKWVKEAYEWLWGHQKEGGCYSVCFEADDKYRYCVCIGWTGGYEKTPESPDGWRVGWKIGRQTHNNVMQCDFEIDFEMPYDPETGDVDDTCESIERKVLKHGCIGYPREGAPVGYKSWDALAAYIRKTARRVWNDWKEISDE